jgi:hypothetical protein
MRVALRAPNVATSIVLAVQCGQHTLLQLCRQKALQAVLQAGLPLAFMDADHKTVKRLLDSMVTRGRLCAPVTMDVPVMKSRMTLCKPRAVSVFCVPEAKVPFAALLVYCSNSQTTWHGVFV